MKRTNPRLALLLTIALGVGGAALFAASSAGGQSSSDTVPVDFESSGLEKTPLHFAREGDGAACTATVQETDDGTNVNPLCQMVIEPPEETGSADPKSERRSVQSQTPDDVDNEEDVVRFTLDARPDDNLFPNRIPDGAEYPFTIRSSASALTTVFHYSTDAVCDEDVPLGAGEQQPLDFHVRYYKVSEDELQNPTEETFAEPLASAAGTDCGNAAENIASQNADRVSITADLDEPVSFEQDEAIVTEIFAVNAEADDQSLSWEIYFDDDDFDSRTELRSPEAIQHATWTTDRSGTVKETFDPNAAEDDRFMIPHLALRSPFGGDAILTDAYDLQIRDPDGVRVDLLTDDDEETRTLGIEENEDLRKRAGAQRVFAIEHPEDHAQPWNYPEGVQSGAYQVEIEGDVIRDTSRTFSTTVAMGAFDFSLEPMDAESTSHLLHEGSSTTFLLDLSNTGTNADTYRVDAEFAFSEGGAPWSVDLLDVDSSDRLSVDPGEDALLRVKVTPPEGAAIGDRARVTVDAESVQSGSEENLTLEAQVTDRTVRDVGALVIADQPVAVGIDETTRLSAFAWNQGTARDGMSVSVVDNSTQAEDPDLFDVEVAQTEITGVSPGDVASVPIDVTTESGVSEGDQLTFDLRVQSRADTGVGATLTVETVVDADRQLTIVGLDHQNDEALESLRFSRFNRSEAGVGTCEPALRDEVERPEECDDYHNWTYHRAVVTNTGDQQETVDLSIVPGGDIPGRTESIPSPNRCTTILQDRIEQLEAERDIEPVQIVDSIDHDEPGSEDALTDLDLDPDEARVIYLRIGYDGRTPYHEDTGSDACNQESFHATILASLDNGETKSLSTETVFPFENTGDMSDEARGRLALTDTYSREDGSFAQLPTRTGLELGETTTINFTLSLQQAHEDQAHVELANSNRIDALEEDGWDIELVSLDAQADRDGPHEITVPSDGAVQANESIAHASGVDHQLGLALTPPESGIQESERFSFTVLAFSDERPDERDTVGIDTQIGQTYAFDLGSGADHLRAHPGDQVAFALDILNQGATRDGYNIDVESSSDAVEVAANPDDPQVSSGSQQTSAIELDIASDAPENTEVTITTTVTAERGTPGDTADDLGPKTVEYTVDIQPPSTLTMEPERDVVSVSPGGQSAIDFSITNEKDTPQDVEIDQLVGPTDWNTSLSDGTETRRIGGGETITQTVLLEAPDTIVEGSTFPFVIQAQNFTTTEDGERDLDPSEFAVAKAEAIAQGQTALSLEVERNQTQVVDRGATTEFPILVRNPGTSPTTYQLSASFESEDWLASFAEADSGDALQDDSIEVPENEFRRVLVEVQAPNDVARGHVEDVIVSGFAEGQRSVTDQVDLEAAIHDFGVELEVTGAQAKDAAPGDNVPFEVAITNTGNGEDEISLAFSGPEGEDPRYPVTSALTDDTTPALAPGETLENVTVSVQIPSPSPDRSLATGEDGVEAVIEARSGGDLPSGTVPTATAQVSTRLVDYVINDVDQDTAFEVAIDLNRDLGDGYEVFRDQDVQMIERGELNSSQSVASEGLHVVDGDEDDRAEHIVDTDSDGVGNIYFDPDRARTYSIPFTVDVTGDGQAEHPIDADFDGVVDGVFDPADEVLLKAAHLDLSGDGRKDVLVDTNGDTRFDRYVNPHENPPVVTEVERDGDLYKVDTDGSGTIDTHYDVETQSIQDAETANLQTFLGSYWYVLVAFLAVVVAFGVIFYRQL